MLDDIELPANCKYSLWVRNYYFNRALLLNNDSWLREGGGLHLL